MQTILCGIVVLCLLSEWALPAAAAGEPPKRIDLATLRDRRQQAARRTRRVIFNNDGDDVIYTRKPATADALLARRTTPLLGSQVDSIFYSNSLCFGHALHRSAVMEPFTCTEDMFQNNSLPGLMARGIDPIQVMASFCHQHGIEIFWDMRMNDTHDAKLDGYGPLLRPKFKLDHPEYLVGSPTSRPRCGSWSSVDYARPEVRELAYRFFEEACRTFDVDGIEMDFFRHASFFKTVADGGQASQAELDAMTELVRRVREMTEREGMRRGRPILIAIRVPDSVEFCRGIGLDVEEWLARGMVDILIGSGYFRLNRWDYLVALGHRYGVPVYPCLSESRVRTDTRFRRNSIESYRARAMRAWAAGADGIYIFNYFNPRGAIWRELGDREALRKMDKLYFVTVRDGSPDRYLNGGVAHCRVPILTPSRPHPMAAHDPTQVELVVGDDLGAAKQLGVKPTVTLHVQTLGAPNVEATLNGHRLGAPEATDDWLDFPVDPAWVQTGLNQLAFRAKPEGDPSRPPRDWTLVYTGDKLPGRPWHKVGFSRNCVAEVQDGRLLIADRGTEGGNYAYFSYPCYIWPEDETIVEARFKPLSGWSSILVDNGVSGEEIQFFTDRIKARFCGLAYEMDTTDAFHTYRIAVQRRDFKVYVDGQLRIDGSGKYTRPAHNGRSGVMFGAANSPSLGEAHWESVKVRNKAVSLLDVALSIRFGE